MIFSDMSCQIRSNADVFAQVPRQNKMYVLDCSPAESANICEETNREERSSDGSGAAGIQVWHARLGHLPAKMLNDMASCVDDLKTMKRRDA